MIEPEKIGAEHRDRLVVDALVAARATPGLLRVEHRA